MSTEASGNGRVSDDEQARRADPPIGDERGLQPISKHSRLVVEVMISSVIQLKSLLDGECVLNANWGLMRATDSLSTEGN